MSSQVNLDAAIEIAKARAELYARKFFTNSDIYSVAYNAHLAGLLECLGERESLRAMLERKAAPLAEVMAPMSINPLPPQDLDSFI